MSEYLAGEVFREAGEGVPVGQPPVDEVLGLARDRRRRRLTWGAGVVVATVAALGIGTWVGTRPPETELPDVVVRSEPNPANIEWYGNGVLHLDKVTVELPQVTALVQVPDGVVFADRAGRVVLVDVEGTLTFLGRSEPDTPLAASADRGWVAWLEPGSQPDLVVHDTVTRHELARRTVTKGTRPIAIDQARVYYDEAGETWSWQLPDFEPVLVPEADYVDVAASVRIRKAAPGFVELMEPLLDEYVTIPGSDAVLSPDADYVLTRLDLALPEVVRIYDANGDPVETGLDDDNELALAAAFGPDQTITYVVTQRDQSVDGDPVTRLSESRLFELRTCTLGTGSCTDITQLGNGHGLPVLPNN